MSSFIQDQILKRAIDVLFLKYDKDRSGTLDMNQLTGAFNTLLNMIGVPEMATSFILGQLLKRMDKDGDGRINKQEFLNLFRLFQSQQQQQQLQNQNQGGWGQQQQNQGGWNQPQNQGGWGQQQNQGGWGNQPQNQGNWGNQPQNYNQPNNFGNQGPGSGFGYGY